MSGVWLWIPMAGAVRISTLIGAAVVIGVMTIVKRDPIGGIVITIAWSSLFETIYQLVGIVGYHWPLGNFLWQTMAVGGWIILAATLDYWLDWRLAGAFIVAMGVWVAFGFHYNVPGQSTPINLRDEVLNEMAKSLLGVAYLVGALNLRAGKSYGRIGRYGASFRSR